MNGRKIIFNFYKFMRRTTDFLVANQTLKLKLLEIRS